MGKSQSDGVSISGQVIMTDRASKDQGGGLERKGVRYVEKCTHGSHLPSLLHGQGVLVYTAHRSFLPEQ